MAQGKKYFQSDAVQREKSDIRGKSDDNAADNDVGADNKAVDRQQVPKQKAVVAKSSEEGHVDCFEHVPKSSTNSSAFASKESGAADNTPQQFQPRVNKTPEYAPYYCDKCQPSSSTSPPQQKSRSIQKSQNKPKRILKFTNASTKMNAVPKSLPRGKNPSPPKKVVVDEHLTVREVLSQYDVKTINDYLARRSNAQQWSDDLCNGCNETLWKKVKRQDRIAITNALLRPHGCLTLPHIHIICRTQQPI